jgi:hypothetical protein
MKKIIIGTDQEPTYYKVGSYIFQQRPGSLYYLEEGNRVYQILEMLGFADYSKLGEQTLQQYFDTLDKGGKAFAAVQMLLEFYDATPLHRVWRVVRMFLTRQTKESILSRKNLTYGVTARVLLDFFGLNFCSMPASKVSSSRTALNLKTQENSTQKI